MISEAFFFFFLGLSSVLCANHTSISDKDIKEVHAHYTNYPYPPIEPEKDDQIFIIPVQVQPQMPELNHYIFNGRGDLGQGSEAFRILIAGGGTGQSLLHYARLFRDLNASIVYLDFSLKSLEIAKKRALRHSYVDRITYVHNSIYNIPKLALGTFDFIDCYGVLHHLPDPDEGLRILKDSLAPNGGMILMLYSYYGRQGIYSMQESLRILNQNSKNLSLEEEVSRSRILYNNTNLMSRMHALGYFLEGENDIGFYDLYLHKKDRAFTIPELYEYIEEQGGLQIVNFVENKYRGLLNRNEELFPHCNDTKKKLALNELISGQEIKQAIYVSRCKTSSEASLDDLENIPFLNVDNYKLLLNTLSTNSTMKFIKLRVKYNQHHLPDDIIIPISKYTNRFLKLISYNQYSVEQIINYAVKNFKTKQKDLKKFRSKLLADFKKIIGHFVMHGMVLLRHYSSPVFPQITLRDALMQVDYI